MGYNFESKGLKNFADFPENFKKIRVKISLKIFKNYVLNWGFSKLMIKYWAKVLKLKGIF